MQPLLDALDGPLLEQRVDGRLVALHGVILVAGLLHPVVAGVFHRLLDGCHFFRGVHLGVLAHEVAFAAAAGLLDEGDEDLAKQVAVEYRYVDSVDGEGVQKLAVAHVGPVDIGHVEQLEHLSLLSSGPGPSAGWWSKTGKV